MKVVFLDRDYEQGEAVDDGTTYSWTYPGSDTAILDILNDSETWTGISTERVEPPEDVADYITAITGESFNAPIDSIDRMRQLTQSLRPHVAKVNRID